MRRLFLALLLVARTAAAVSGPAQSPLLLEDDVVIGACHAINYQGTLANCILRTDGICECQKASTLLESGGGQIGPPGDFSPDGVWLGGNRVQMPNGSTLTAADCNDALHVGRDFQWTAAPSGAQHFRCEDLGGSVYAWVSQGARIRRLGGTGADGALTWDGSTGCSCSGCTPVGALCRLTPNSVRTRVAGETGFTSCAYNFLSVNLSGTGALICGDPPTAAAAPVMGRALLLRVRDDVLIEDSGQIVTAAYGMAAGLGGASGGTAANRAGGNGASNAFTALAPGAAAGGSLDAGSAGTSVNDTGRLEEWDSTFLGQGSGGGGGASGGFVGAAAYNGLVNSGIFVSTRPYGGTGGGGGEAQTAAENGSAGGNGGRGGAEITLEIGGDFTCVEDGKLDASGADGANASAEMAGGAAGGGAIIRLKYGGVLTDSECEYDVTGGTGGTSGANASDGGVGGDGAVWKRREPS